MQTVDFGSVVVDGERIERDAQLGEVAFALGQGFVGGFEHGVEHLARAVGQRGAVGVDFAQAVAEILRAVQQLLEAVVEVARAVHELAHRVGQLAADFVKVKAEGKLAVLGFLIGHAGGGHQRVGAAEAEVGHIRADDGGGGDVVKVDVHFVAGHAALERLGQSGQAVAEHQRAVADLEHAAVGHLKIGENVVLGQHHGGHQEGNGQRLGLAVDLGLAGQVGGIVDGHFEMTALAGQLGGRHFHAVERVMEGDGEGQLLGGMALIADFGTIRVPDELVAVLRECLIAGEIFNAAKAAYVLERIERIAVIQPLADHDVGRLAAGVGQHIHHFLFVHVGQRGHGGEQHDRSHDQSHNALFHSQFSSFTVWGFMPSVVWRISPSQSMSNAGSMKITSSIETIAPRAISIHMELMMSMSE